MHTVVKIKSSLYLFCGLQTWSASALIHKLQLVAMSVAWDQSLHASFQRGGHPSQCRPQRCPAPSSALDVFPVLLPPHLWTSLSGILHEANSLRSLKPCFRTHLFSNMLGTTSESSSPTVMKANNALKVCASPSFFNLKWTHGQLIWTDMPP